MKRLWLSFIALVVGVSLAFAQSPVTTQPYAVTSFNASSTIAVTNTFQSIWLANTGTRGRAACAVQNNGTNNMWVYFGTLADATKAISVVLTPGQSVSCNVGGTTLQDGVSITGTSGDAFFAAQQ